MNKPSDTRLDDKLNGILIAVTAAVLVVFTLDAAWDDHQSTVAGASPAPIVLVAAHTPAR